MRRQVSLLQANGHPAVRQYPVGRVWEEAELVVERLNREAATQATVLHAAYAATQTKKGSQHFNKLVKRLNNG